MEILAKNNLDIQTKNDKITKEFDNTKDHIKENILHRFQQFLLISYKKNLGN